MATWSPEEERIYGDLAEWFLARYEDPNENCPYESAEGGYQFIWGGPYDAEEELFDAWGHLYDMALITQVAERLCKEQDCVEWCGVPEAEEES